MNIAYLLRLILDEVVYGLRQIIVNSTFVEIFPKLFLDTLWQAIKLKDCISRGTLYTEKVVKFNTPGPTPEARIFLSPSAESSLTSLWSLRYEIFKISSSIADP